MLENIKNEVKILMGSDDDGHGFEHVERVYNMALNIAKKENADATIVALAALLHDADDYKIFGHDCADNLTNSRKIMAANNVDNDMQEIVCDIINNMGYSKSLKGIRPKTLEGKIVSDADMIDTLGATGIVRIVAYTVTLKERHQLFEKDIFPRLNMSAEQYKQKGQLGDNFVNHCFEKIFKLKNMIFTDSGKEEANIRHKTMIDFFYAFFRESNCPEWVEYLENYEKNNLSKVA